MKVIIDLEKIKKNFDYLSSFCKDIDADIYYSSKSNNLPVISSYLNKMGSAIKCASIDEVYFAIKNSYQIDKILYSGPCKDYQSLLFAIRHGIKIIIDSLDEYLNILDISAKYDIKCNILLNISHDDAGNISQFTNNTSKLGISIAETEKIINNISNNICIEGLASNMGCDIANLDMYKSQIAILLSLIDKLPKYFNKKYIIDIGEVLPANSINNKSFELNCFMLSLFDYFKESMDFNKVKLLIEPGRYLFDAIEQIVANIITIKEIEYGKLLFIDASVKDISSIYTWKHSIEHISKNIDPNAERNSATKYLITGYNCFEGDYLALDFVASNPSIGDEIIFGNVGSYDLMSSVEGIRKKPDIYIKLHNNIFKVGYPNFLSFNELHAYNHVQVRDDIYLRKTNFGDEQEIFNIIKNNYQDFSQSMDWVKYINSAEDILDFIIKTINDSENAIEFNYVVCKADKIVGNLSIRNNNEKKFSIGYWLDNAYQKQGIMTECVRKISSILIKNNIAKTIYIYVAVGNHKSNSIPKRCNYDFVGIIKNNEYLNGSYYDQELYIFK